MDDNKIVPGARVKVHIYERGARGPWFPPEVGIVIQAPLPPDRTRTVFVPECTPPFITVSVDCCELVTGRGAVLAGPPDEKC